MASRSASSPATGTPTCPSQRPERTDRRRAYLRQRRGHIGIYVPVFTTQPRRLVTYLIVLLLLVAVWMRRQPLSRQVPHIRVLFRWGHLLLPLVLIGIGLAILTEGGAFGRPT